MIEVSPLEEARAHALYTSHCADGLARAADELLSTIVRIGADSLSIDQCAEVARVFAQLAQAKDDKNEAARTLRVMQE